MKKDKMMNEIMFTRTAVHVRTVEELDFVLDNSTLAADRDKILKGFNKYKNRTGLYASAVAPVFQVDALYKLVTHDYKIIPFEDFKEKINEK